MKVKTFRQIWKNLSPAEKTQLAKGAKTSTVYLSQVANGHRRAGINLISKLRAINPVFTSQVMRPDIYPSERKDKVA